MLLNKLISKVEVINKVGDLNLDITNIHSDSRKLKKKVFLLLLMDFLKWYRIYSKCNKKTVQKQ